MTKKNKSAVNFQTRLIGKEIMINDRADRECLRCKSDRDKDGENEVFCV